ncbi:hypothetical protein MRX96_003948 [Rhipicephalus microplus]
MSQGRLATSSSARIRTSAEHPYTSTPLAFDAVAAAWRFEKNEKQIGGSSFVFLLQLFSPSQVISASCSGASLIGEIDQSQNDAFLSLRRKAEFERARSGNNNVPVPSTSGLYDGGQCRMRQTSRTPVASRPSVSEAEEVAPPPLGKGLSRDLALRRI